MGTWRTSEFTGSLFVDKKKTFKKHEVSRGHVMGYNGQKRGGEAVVAESVLEPYKSVARFMIIELSGACSNPNWTG